MNDSSKPFFTGCLALAGLTAVALSLACGGGGGSVLPASNPPSNPTAQTGTLNLTVSDASTEDWATIGVKVLSIALVPQGGGSPVIVFTAPTPAPLVNLVQLDQLSEILGNLSVSTGTYTGAVLTISANPGDVTLVTSADPEAGFDGTASTTIPAGQIQIQGAKGAAGSKTVTVNLNLVSNLVVAQGQSTPLDLEFDLAHPAFIVDHLAPGDTQPYWAVNFNGPVRHHPALAENLVLRHLYGTVSAVAADNSSITVTKDYPVWPITTPAETATASTQSLTILPDSVNGTLFYNLDVKPVTAVPIKDFSTVAATLPNEYVRIAARYQADGSLVATRIFASSSFNNVFVGPEGHVLHVNTATEIIDVQNEQGVPVPMLVNGGTQFFFRTPASALAEETPIATGTAWFNAGNLVRGFKVHATVDPTTTPMTALTVDIEIAKYDGTITVPDSPDFTYTRKFFTATDDYTMALGYIAPATPNGTNPATGAAIDGYKWWNFGFPALVDVDPTGADFLGAVGGSVNFGGTAGAYKPWGVSYTTWNDPAAADAWSARASILLPTELPKGTVSTAWASGSFGLSLPGGANAVTVNLDTTSGSAALVYQVDRTGAVVTVSPVDITTAAGQQSLATNLTSGEPVRVYAVPQTGGTLKGYVLLYFTGTKPQ